MKITLLSCFVLLFASALALSRYTGKEKKGEVDYSGHMLVNAFVDTVQQLEKLNRLYENPKSYIDLWTDIKLGPVEVLIPPGEFNSFAQLNIPYEIIVEDVQVAINQRDTQRTLKNGTWFESYHDLDEINAWMDELVNTHKSIAKKISIGYSYEGESINGIRITGKNPTRSIIHMGGHHSNEWIGVAVTSYILDQLLAGYGSDSTITKMVDEFEWTIIPVLNVDGYRYTWTVNSGWRKTRKPNSGNDCVGTDPNRNWPYKWNNGGSSSNPCSSSYHGTQPFDNPEPRAMSDYIALRNSAGIPVLSYVDWHCCGLMWMNPWGYSCTDFPRDDAIQKQVGDIAVSAALSVNGVSYENGNICNVIYQASGSSVDHTYGNLGVVFSYATEMRSNTQFNPDRIIPNAEEMWAAVTAYTVFLFDAKY